MKLLIVEDEDALRSALCRGFGKLGYTWDGAVDGEEALDLYFSNIYNLIVLDLNLPKLDGIDILKEIRKENKDIPVLILSARSEVDDKILGLDEGANDYLAKPFHFNELEARVRALLRRDFKTIDTMIELKLATIDTKRKKLFIQKVEVSLTKKEYSIVEYLGLRKGEAVSATELIEQIWGDDIDDVLNSFKVHLSIL